MARDEMRSTSDNEEVIEPIRKISKKTARKIARLREGIEEQLIG